jgi:16S rRNA processing protein RimM
VLLEVGRITKPHGIRGEVIVELVTDRTERVAAGSVLQGVDRSFVVASATPHQGRWIVQFDGVHSREGAEALRGVVLAAEALEDPEAFWVHELIGAVVVDAGDGVERGRVVSVVANPASDLLELEGGALVPLHFVTGRADGRIEVEVPEGLWD